MSNDENNMHRNNNICCSATASAPPAPARTADQVITRAHATAVDGCSDEDAQLSPEVPAAVGASPQQQAGLAGDEDATTTNGAASMTRLEPPGPHVTQRLERATSGEEEKQEEASGDGTAVDALSESRNPNTMDAMTMGKHLHFLPPSPRSDNLVVPLSRASRSAPSKIDAEQVDPVTFQMEDAHPGAVAVAGPGTHLRDSWGSFNADQEDEPDEENAAPQMLSSREGADLGLAVANPVTETNNNTLPVAMEMTPAIEDNRRHHGSDNISRGVEPFCCDFLKSHRCIIASVLCIVGLVVALLSVFVPRSDNDNDTDHCTLSPEEHVLSVLPNCTQEAIKSNDTPQAMAFQFLINDPSLESCSEERIVQRFALATFCHATGGQDWVSSKDWLSCEVHECEWFWNPAPFVVLLKDPTMDFLLEPYRSSLEAGMAPCTTENGVHENFVMAFNNVRGESIPDEFCLLTSLKTIGLVSCNNLRGTLSTFIGHLAQLNALGVGLSATSGTVPSELGQLTNLTYLLFTETELQGTIPSAIGKLSALRTVALLVNLFSGTLPTEIGDLTNLENLGLDENMFTQHVPSELGLLTGLDYLGLYGNQLTGSIPTELGGLHRLPDLDLSWNQLTGSIPSQLALTTSLRILALWNNHIAGQIPTEIGLMTALTALDLAKNQLTGPIPSELGMLTKLTALCLPENQLTGNIPSEFGLLTQLTGLDFQDNLLTGTVPSEVASLEQLHWVCLGCNKLTGTIASELRSLTQLGFIDLAENYFSGTLPSELGLLVLDGDLCCLNITLNSQLTGTVPSYLCDLTDGNFSFDCRESLCGCEWCPCLQKCNFVNDVLELAPTGTTGHLWSFYLIRNPSHLGTLLKRTQQIGTDYLNAR